MAVAKAKKPAAKRGRPSDKTDTQRGGSKKRPWEAAFVKELEQTACISRACDASGIHRSTAYHARKNDKAFREAWTEALEVGCDALEYEARRRAVEGIDEPVFYQGKVCGHIKRFSDNLLVVLLRAHRPEKFRERMSVYTGPELDAETLLLLTDDEVEQGAAGKLTTDQLAAIIATRRAQANGTDLGPGR